MPKKIEIRSLSRKQAEEILKMSGIDPTSLDGCQAKLARRGTTPPELNIRSMSYNNPFTGKPERRLLVGRAGEEENTQVNINLNSSDEEVKVSIAGMIAKKSTFPK